MNGREEVIEAGRWLVRERRKRGGDKLCPQGLVAKLAQVRAFHLGERIKIAQQQISEIERSREDNEVGPKKGLPLWWRHVVWLFESGEIDAAISDNAVAADRLEARAHVVGPPEEGETYFVHDRNGEVVGRFVLMKRPN
jgi:hypothetical protein